MTFRASIFGLSTALILLYVGCSDFLSTDNDPPVQINFGQVMYIPDDTLGFSITNNTGDMILLDGCDPLLKYDFEVFEDGDWIHYTTINFETCPDLQAPWIELTPGEMFIEEIHMDEEEFNPGFYRVVIQYRHEDSASFTEVPSDGVTLTDGETF